MEWNRVDIARNEIFTDDIKINKEQLHYLMEKALIQNKPEFVELLLDHGVDIESFLTLGRLYYLYNSKELHTLARKSPLIKLYRKKIQKGSGKDVILMTFSDVSKILKKLMFEEFDPLFFPKNEIERVELLELIVI